MSSTTLSGLWLPELLTSTLQLGCAGSVQRKNFISCLNQRGPHSIRGLSSLLIVDTSINFYSILHQKKNKQIGKEKPQQDKQNLQHIYTYLFKFSKVLYQKRFHFGTLQILTSNLIYSYVLPNYVYFLKIVALVVI